MGLERASRPIDCGLLLGRALADGQVDLRAVLEPLPCLRGLADDRALLPQRGSLSGDRADLAVRPRDRRSRVGERLADHVRHLARRRGGRRRRRWWRRWWWRRWRWRRWRRWRWRRRRWRWRWRWRRWRRR